MDMTSIKLTPTGNIEDALIIYLNEENTLHQEEMIHIVEQFKNGEKEGTTWDLFPNVQGGVWQLVHPL